MMKLGVHILKAKVLQTYRQTYRPSDEAGTRGAFAPKIKLGLI